MRSDQQRVALLCAGLDRATGGFETHMKMLHRMTLGSRSEIDVTLFKSSGPAGPDEVTLRSPDRHSRCVRILKRRFRDRFFWESALFVVFFVSYVLVKRKRFDRIVVIEPMVRRLLYPFARYLPGRPELVWTHGLNNDPAGYLSDADLVQEVNIENFERASVSPSRSAGVLLLPHFCPEVERPDRAAAKRSLGIETERVVLCVGRVESVVKRCDYVIDEAVTLPERWTLVLCGQPQEPDLVRLAREKLGRRFVHKEAKVEDMAAIYGAADVLVHAATNEGFGIVLIEALRSGVPVVAHDRQLFRWILGNAGVYVDMTQPGQLAAAIVGLDLADDLARLRTTARDRFASDYSWEALRVRYEAMLSGCLEGNPNYVGPNTGRLPTRSLVRSRRQRPTYS